MANKWAAALMGGLGAAANIQSQRQAAEQKKQDAIDLAEAARIAEERRAKYRATYAAPQYQTIKDTGPDGQMRERTIRSSYDPETQGFVETEVGSAILPQKDGRTAFEVEAAYAEANPEKYAAMKAAGRAPRGGSGGEDKPPKASSLTSSEIEALFGTTLADGSVGIDQNSYRQFLAFQARNAGRDANFRDAKFAAQQWANQVGFDPSENVAGTFTLMESANGPVETLTAPGAERASPRQAAPPQAKSQQAPGPQGNNPATGKAPYPDGTRLTGPDGKLYVVKNGQPVLVQ